MTQRQLIDLAREYAEKNNVDFQDILIATRNIKHFLQWLTKTHCIVDKKRLKEMYACYLQNEQVAKRLGLEHPADIAHGSTATIRDIFGSDIFNGKDEQ